MKRAWSVIAACLVIGCAGPSSMPVWDQPPPPVVDAPIVQPGALYRYELDNGLALVILEDHRLPMVSIGLATRRGAASETIETAGLAAFTTELMKRGAGERDALALASAIDEIGGSLGVGAGFDSMTARVGGLTRDQERLIEILADVVLRPRFDPAEAQRTRGEMLAAMERSKEQPNYLERKYATATLYPGLRAGLPIAGTPQSLSGFDAAAAREFHDRMFIPNNAVFFASGDIVAEELLAKIGSAFGAWPAGEIPAGGSKLPSPAPPQRQIVVVDRPDLVQTHITLIHEGLARIDPERISASLMNSVVGGGGFSSRLMKRLRSDTGLTYGVHSGFSMRRDGGSFSVSTFTRVAEVRRAVDIILSELERIRSDPPSQQELDKARARAVGGFQLGLETSNALLAALVNLDVYGLPEDSIDTYRSRLRATTIEDTERLANQLIHPERAAIVLVGPAEALVPQLEGLGPIEVIIP
ncbi:MAG: pitrilysin family protein [Myxococcota bacterium]